MRQHDLLLNVTVFVGLIPIPNGILSVPINSSLTATIGDNVPYFYEIPLSDNYCSFREMNNPPGLVPSRVNAVCNLIMSATSVGMRAR